MTEATIKRMGRHVRERIEAENETLRSENKIHHARIAELERTLTEIAALLLDLARTCREATLKGSVVLVLVSLLACGPSLDLERDDYDAGDEPTTTTTIPTTREDARVSNPLHIAFHLGTMASAGAERGR